MSGIGATLPLLYEPAKDGYPSGSRHQADQAGFRRDDVNQAGNLKPVHSTRGELQSQKWAII